MNESEIDGYKRNRQKLFLDIVRDIYNIYYESNEGKRIDHNREVSLALELIQTNRYSASYDYIFIDEYQDINQLDHYCYKAFKRLLMPNYLLWVMIGNLFINSMGLI